MSKECLSQVDQWLLESCKEVQLPSVGKLKHRKNEQKHQSIAGETVSDYLCHEGGGEVRRQCRARRRQPDQESRHRARGAAQVFSNCSGFYPPNPPIPPNPVFIHFK